MRPLISADIGDRIVLSGELSRLDTSFDLTDEVSVKVWKRGQSSPAVHHAEVTSDGWRLLWSPPSSGVWIIRAEALVDGVTVGSENGLVSVRESPIPT